MREKHTGLRTRSRHDQTQSLNISRGTMLTPVSLEILPKSFQKLQGSTESQPATCRKWRNSGTVVNLPRSDRPAKISPSAKYKNHTGSQKEPCFNIHGSAGSFCPWLRSAFRSPPSKRSRRKMRFMAGYQDRNHCSLGRKMNACLQFAKKHLGDPYE